MNTSNLEITRSIIELITSVILLVAAIIPIASKRFRAAKKDGRAQTVINILSWASSGLLILAMLLMWTPFRLACIPITSVAFALFIVAFLRIPEPAPRVEIVMLVVLGLITVYVSVALPTYVLLEKIVDILARMVNHAA